MATSEAPSGKTIKESMKLPSKLTEQIDAEHMPPKKMSFHHEYICGRRISTSRSADASATDSLS
jgi:hypothetical protein